MALAEVLTQNVNYLRGCLTYPLAPARAQRNSNLVVLLEVRKVPSASVKTLITNLQYRHTANWPLIKTVGFNSFGLYSAIMNDSRTRLNGESRLV
jgi:hypothetical protein